MEIIIVIEEASGRWIGDYKVEEEWETARKRKLCVVQGVWRKKSGKWKSYF